MTSNKWCVAAFLVIGIALSGCAGAIPPMDDPDTTQPEQSSSGDINSPQGSIFGSDGIDLLDIVGVGGGKRSSGTGGGIGVNSYLWRASLDTISFMPLSSADPFGGVIITDWYTPPETPNERFKMNVYILGRQLRADGIRVALFRQNLGNGQWADARVGKKTSVKLENQILSRARQLRVAAQSGRN
ncbi:MAG: DUF3576 domain-containing protein [Pseudomonadota bacterium]|nr:DUF3576 domain-containing protein [Pseudomonadota bacterium]